MLVVFSGTNGIGKTYAENLLCEKYGFNRLVKYVDRPYRSEEIGGKGLVSLSKEEFDRYEKSGKFFFDLEYFGRHAWLKSDYNPDSSVPSVISIKLKDLDRLCQSVKDVLPIELTLANNNIELIESRLKRRENFNEQSPEKQEYLSEQISARLAKVAEEIDISAETREMIKNNNGYIFEVLDDTTIPKVVIPFILNKLNIKS